MRTLMFAFAEQAPSYFLATHHRHYKGNTRRLHHSRFGAIFQHCPCRLSQDLQSYARTRSIAYRSLSGATASSSTPILPYDDSLNCLIEYNHPSDTLDLVLYQVKDSQGL